MADRPNNRVSMGRSNSEPWCRTCPHLKADGKGWGGWCQHPANRTPPDSGWPTGFTPSQAFDGGCDLHPAHVSGVTVPGHHPEQQKTLPKEGEE
jgi:hypothetical protein